MAGGGVGHMDQFGLVGSSHHDEIGQRGQVRDIEAAGVSRAIGADQPGAVDGKAHGQVLDRHVMHHLVKGALEEGGIDRAERPHALGGKARGKSYRMLFGDADIEAAFGIQRSEFVEAGAGRHGSGNRADFGIARRLGDQRLREHPGIAGRAGWRLGLFAGDDVEFADAVVFVGGGFGRAVALALLSDDMDQAGALGGIAHVFQHRHEMVEIMPVDRPDVIKAELFEQRAAHGEAAREFVGTAGGLMQRPGQAARQAPGQFAQFQKGP